MPPIHLALAQVEVQVSHQEVLLSPSLENLPIDTALHISAPDLNQRLQVPLAIGDDKRQEQQQKQRQQLTQASVWEWSGTAADEGDDAADWFSEFLQKRCRLVRYLGSAAAPPVARKGQAEQEGGAGAAAGGAAAGGAATAVGGTVRPTDAEFAPGGEVAFADGFPVLVVREVSWGMSGI
jgi:uncharacterized protein YcbX